MPVIVTVLFVGIVGLLVYYITSITAANRRATNHARLAERAAGQAVQALRDLRLTVLTGSDQDYIIGQVLADIESALDKAKENN